METLNHIDGERDIPNVTSDQQARWKRGVLLLTFVCVIALAGSMWYARLSASTDTTTTQTAMRSASSIPARVFEFAQPEPEPEPEPAMVEPVPVPPPPPRSYTSGPRKPVKRVDVDKSSTGLTVPTLQVAPVTGVQVANNGDLGAGLLGGDTNAGLTGTATAAYTLPNHDKLLTQGKTIQCGTDLRTITSVAGMFVCRTTSHVYSAGSSIVIPKGSTITGEYQTATRAGNRRIYILMNRVRTPSGVVAMIESPATGPLGASGIEGNVNTHFWQRFGGAMLLSIVDDVVTAATRTDTNADIVIGGAANTGSELAGEVLRNTINIPPTVYANHGQPIAITVARDIDFSGVL